MIGSLHAKGEAVFLLCHETEGIVGIERSFILKFSELTAQYIATDILFRFSRVVRIIGFGPSAAPMAFLLQQKFKSNFPDLTVRMSIPVLHPREFMMDDEKWHVHALNRFLCYAIHPRNLVFMNEICRVSHAAFFDIDLSSNEIVPVPIDSRLPRWRTRQKDGLVRIVAVGRIVEFKAYNFSLPEIIVELVAGGLDITCDIYGYGISEGRLCELIEAHGMCERVKFHGPVDLAAFDDLVSGFDLFIGMGTAALQAAQLGVPTILAIVDDERGAHGFLHTAPFSNLGEQDASATRQDLGDLIARYACLSSDERLRLSQQGIEYANRYVVDDYVEKINLGGKMRTGWSAFIGSLYCHFYIWMAQDNSLRKTVRWFKSMNFSGRAS